MAYQPCSLQGPFRHLTMRDINSWRGLGAYMLSALILSERSYPAFAPGGTTGTLEVRQSGSSRTTDCSPQISCAHDR